MGDMDEPMEATDEKNSRRDCNHRCEQWPAFTGEFSNSGLDKCLQILLNPSTKRILQRSKKNAARGRRQCSMLWQLAPGSDGVNF